MGDRVPFGRGYFECVRLSDGGLSWVIVPACEDGPEDETGVRGVCVTDADVAGLVRDLEAVHVLIARHGGHRIADVAADVARAHGVCLADVCGPSRLRHLVRARQAVMHRLVHVDRFAVSEIGRFLGGRDHTTVLHGVRAHAARSGAPFITQQGISHGTD
jgi:hypothetical protein